jgi:ubiquinone/menaquinone biosynthesis C-methylase UbiE
LDPPQLAQAVELIRLLNCGAMSQAVCVAAQLGVADELASGPKHVAALAQHTGAHAPSLHRLMRALVSLDLCLEIEDGLFSLTATGSCLRSDTALSLRSWAMLSGTHMRSMWGHLLYSVKTGCRASELATGAGTFGLLSRDGENAAVFNRAMAEITRLVGHEVLRAYDFRNMRRIVDVGGGYGALIAAVLQAYPDSQGVLFDLPHALNGARIHLAEAGVEKRCEFAVGDFFESVPAAADGYLLKTILHDWSDEECTTILTNCRRAMAPSAKLLLIERILPDRFSSSPLHQAIARADLSMLVGHTGRERTEAEFAGLLASSGFKLARVTVTGLEFSVLEGVPD